MNSSSPIESSRAPEVPLPAAGRILVIEDDRPVQKALKRLFESEGYHVDVAADGTSGLEIFHATPPDVVVLDLRLPKTSGYDVCRQIAERDPQLPIVVLSAQADVVSKVALLESGALDYVTKPFSPRELLARVRAVIRRVATQGNTGDVFAFDGVSVSFSKMEVTRDGDTVALTPQEFKALEFMIRNAGRVVSRKELLNEVWGYQNYPSTRTVDQHILTLRRKLEREPSQPLHLLTIHSAGYKFVP